MLGVSPEVACIGVCVKLPGYEVLVRAFDGDQWWDRPSEEVPYTHIYTDMCQILLTSLPGCPVGAAPSGWMFRGDRVGGGGGRAGPGGAARAGRGGRGRIPSGMSHSQPTHCVVDST